MGKTNEWLTAEDKVLAEGMDLNAFTRGQRTYRAALIKKWGWLLENREGLPEIKNRRQAETMSMLFENQAGSSIPGLMEATMTSDIVMPVKYSLPLIRLVWPQLIAQRIASIQPMPLSSGGVGKIFYQNFETEDIGPGGAPAAGRDLNDMDAADSDYAYAGPSARVLADYPDEFAEGATTGENTVPRRIKMTITGDTIVAIKDILAATWSTEVMEDVRGVFGLNVENELVMQCGGEIIREMDQRVINEIVNGASAGTATWTWTVPAAYMAREWYETLVHAFLDAEKYIWDARYRKAQWIVCGSNVATYLAKSQMFQGAARDRWDALSAGIVDVGRYNKMWDVYTSVFMNTNTAVMGFYPQSMTDTGYILAPYIPITPMPLVYGSFAGINDATMPGAYKNTDKWTRNVRTRYGRKLVQGDCFALITIAAS